MADFDLVSNGKLTAVYSRTRANAERFAGEYGSPKVFDTLPNMSVLDELREKSKIVYPFEKF